MASRKEQKEAARERRLAEEAAARQKAQRTRRMQMLGGVVVAAIIVVVVLVVVSTHSGKSSAVAVKPSSAKAKSIAATVNSELSGIHQSGNVLGNPKAKVTLTEYGDLECPICQEFAVGAETQLINNEVKQGRLKIVYKSLETASDEPSAAPDAYNLQQEAAYSAGAQGKAWNYILLFYHEQQTENTPYVTAAFLTGLAHQVSGLKVGTWNTDRFDPAYSSEVVSDASDATKLGLHGTPSLSFSGPKSQTQYIDGAITYAQAQAYIKQVS